MPDVLKTILNFLPSMYRQYPVPTVVIIYAVCILAGVGIHLGVKVRASQLEQNVTSAPMANQTTTTVNTNNSTVTVDNKGACSNGVAGSVVTGNITSEGCDQKQDQKKKDNPKTEEAPK